MTRKVLMRLLTERGYECGLDGLPIEPPSTLKGELQRAAWEQGWREGHAKYERAIQQRERAQDMKDSR